MRLGIINVGYKAEREVAFMYEGDKVRIFIMPKAQHEVLDNVFRKGKIGKTFNTKRVTSQIQLYLKEKKLETTLWELMKELLEKEGESISKEEVVGEILYQLEYNILTDCMNLILSNLNNTLEEIVIAYLKEENIRSAIKYTIEHVQSQLIRNKQA